MTVKLVSKKVLILSIGGTKSGGKMVFSLQEEMKTIPKIMILIPNKLNPFFLNILLIYINSLFACQVTIKFHNISHII